MSETAAEAARRKETARQTRTERELAALGEGTGSRTPRKPAAAARPKAKPKEKRGTGRDDSQTNFNRLAKGLRAQISAAKSAGNTGLAVKLEARLVELRKTIT